MEEEILGWWSAFISKHEAEALIARAQAHGRERLLMTTHSDDARAIDVFIAMQIAVAAAHEKAAEHAKLRLDEFHASKTRD
jgi:hypothetical protein